MSCGLAGVARKIYNQELARPIADEVGRLTAIYLYSQRAKKVSLGRRRLQIAMEPFIAQTVKIRQAG